MITLRKSAERGHFDHGWLETYHSFSFADYHDPQHMGFGALRVINEDRVAPGRGFPLHPHRDMEILTFIISGALEHRDDLGSREVIRAGEVQRMSAGSGVLHSEANPSASEPVHLLQIWIQPGQKGIEPGYEKRTFAGSEKGPLQLIAAPDGRDGAATLHQDALVYAGRLEQGEAHAYRPAAGRHLWVQLIDGELEINGAALHTGDGAALSEESDLSLHAAAASRFILFDLA